MTSAPTTRRDAESVNTVLEKIEHLLIDMQPQMFKIGETEYMTDKERDRCCEAQDRFIAASPEIVRALVKVAKTASDLTRWVTPGAIRLVGGIPHTAEISITPIRDVQNALAELAALQVP